MMLSTVAGQTSASRVRMVDRLRIKRELELPLVVSDEDARTLLEELDLLQIVAGLADSLVCFPVSPDAQEAAAQLRHALRRWRD